MLDDYTSWMEKVKAEPKREDLVEGLLPAGPGFLLLAGRPGIGKTNLVLQLAFCIATGTPFLGLQVKQATVGYMGFEGAKPKLLDRLEKLAGNFPNVGGRLKLDIIPPFKLEIKTTPRFKQLIENCQVVILDPLKYSIRGDYIKPDDAHRFLTEFQQILTTLNLSAVVCHHVRKPDSRSLLNPADIWEVKGAGDYAEAATTVMVLERKRQGHRKEGGFDNVNPDRVVLHFPKARDAVAAMEPMELAFNREKLLFEKLSAFGFVIET